jgi:hypothetical protein
MKPTRLCTALLAAVCAVCGTARAADPHRESLSASGLAARLDALQQNGSSHLRLRLETDGPSGKSVLQIQILQLRTPAATHLLCQILWPKERQGEGVLLKQEGRKPISGFVFTPPDAMKAVDGEALREPLFGSDLRLADLIENFYAWESQTFGAEEEAGRVKCRILESKPGGGRRTVDVLVRSWIDTARLVPMRVEKFSKPGRPGRIFETTRVTREEDGRFLPASLTIRAPDAQSTTSLEGSRINTRVSYTPENFTPDALRAIQKPTLTGP